MPTKFIQGLRSTISMCCVRACTLFCFSMPIPILRFLLTSLSLLGCSGMHNTWSFFLDSKRGYRCVCLWIKKKKQCSNVKKVKKKNKNKKKAQNKKQKIVTKICNVYVCWIFLHRYRYLGVMNVSNMHKLHSHSLRWSKILQIYLNLTPKFKKKWLPRCNTK